jgi:hypothetical protein
VNHASPGSGTENANCKETSRKQGVSCNHEVSNADDFYAISAASEFFTADKVEVDLMPNRKLSVRPKGSGSIDAFIGSLKSPDNPVLTLEEIKEAIEKGWAGER